MNKPNTKFILEEKSEIGLKYINAPEYIAYETKLTIKRDGKKPVVLELKFVGVEPLAAPMPPKKHRINAEDITSLFCKVVKWVKKYNYKLEY